jgi:DNA-binding transcriptional ArsR family regulator
MFNVHVYVNDDTSVSVWQDRCVTESQPGAAAEPVATRAIDDVESLRAMADPIRLAILTALMEPVNGELPIMSAKELAAHLGESQTKLYRHIRQLEAAGLIKVAATRMVSGILEQRYQACQRDLSFGSGFLREHADESEGMLQAMMANFREGFFTAFRDAKRAPGAVPPEESFRRPKIFAGSAKVSLGKAAELRSLIDEFLSRLDGKFDEEPRGIRVNLLVAYYAEPGEEGT